MKKHKIDKILNENSHLVDAKVKKDKEIDIMEQSFHLKQKDIQKTIKRMLENLDIDENSSENNN